MFWNKTDDILWKQCIFQNSKLSSQSKMTIETNLQHNTTRMNTHTTLHISTSTTSPSDGELWKKALLRRKLGQILFLNTRTTLFLKLIFSLTKCLGCTYPSVWNLWITFSKKERFIFNKVPDYHVSLIWTVQATHFGTERFAALLLDPTEKLQPVSKYYDSKGQRKEEKI